MNEPLARTQSPMKTDAIGFFGKLPAHGDFVSAAFGSRLQSELDQWVRSGLIALEAALGPDWRRPFHAMSAWRFVVNKGVWAPAAIAGVLLPSRDRVGRSFPLIIAAQLPRFSGQLRDLCEDESWFTAAEALAESSDKADFEMKRFLEGITRLRPPFIDKQSTTMQPAAISNASTPGSLWWRINPGTRQGKGFRTVAAPAAQDFVRLVTAETPKVPVAAEPEIYSVASAAIEAPQTAKVGSADFAIAYSHASHAGTRLTLNADALLLSAAPHIFAIADGVGDGIGAIEAARITTGILAGIPQRDALQLLLQDIKSKLGHAHAILRAKGATAERELPIASVVSATLLDGEFAAIWAGDARCYLLRDGMMRLLTRDHIEIGLRRTLGRALGLKDQFVSETLRDRLQRGDRLLLVSGPLPRTLTDRVIAEILIETPLERAAEALIQEALIANCRENVSAIVIGVT
ncbi:type VI secretion system-associated protein TagF [Rhizobium sp. No.120]